MCQHFSKKSYLFLHYILNKIRSETKYYYFLGVFNIILKLKLIFNIVIYDCIGWIQTLFLWVLKSLENELEFEKLRRLADFWENRYYESETFTHNNMNTESDKRNWTGSSDSTISLIRFSISESFLLRIWWCYRNSEIQTFWNP